jgi:hypothetical protein
MIDIFINIFALIAIGIFIDLFIGCLQLNYYRKRYSKRDVQEFILKFCHGCFCFSTYNPDPDMSYNVYDEQPMTKEQLEILINKLLDDKIIKMFPYNGQNSYCVISDRKSVLLKKLIRYRWYSWIFMTW